MTVHDSNKSEVAWTSWLPALGYALGASTGPVLELGVGHFSTPFLHEYCKASGRGLMSVESDKDWGTGFSIKFNRGSHRFHIGDYAPFIRQLEDAQWGVVFIDNSPGGEGRSIPFSLLKDKARFIVVHDYHRENEEEISPLLNGMDHRIFKDYDPPTLLASRSRL